MLASRFRAADRYSCYDGSFENPENTLNENRRMQNKQCLVVKRVNIMMIGEEELAVSDSI